MGSEEVEIWPDNWASFEVFVAMGTQWRTGVGGPTGLDYGVLESVMGLSGVVSNDRSEVFRLVRLMENAALSAMQKRA